MDYIKLSDKDFPVRWDFMALKEYKAMTKNDALVKFENSTENVIALAFCGIKHGHRFLSEKFELKSEDIAGLMLPRDIHAIVDLFAKQNNVEPVSEGELMPTE